MTSFCGVITISHAVIVAVEAFKITLISNYDALIMELEAWACPRRTAWSLLRALGIGQTFLLLPIRADDEIYVLLWNSSGRK
jgi:hypothetical protein